jgi:hypothetical protein
MPPLAFKIAVSLFHAFIAATSGKTILESVLQGPDLMIWGRSAADDSHTGLHVSSHLSARVVTRLHTRPIPSVTASIRRSVVELSRAVQNVSIRPLMRPHALFEVLDSFFTRPCPVAPLPTNPVVHSSRLQRRCIDRPPSISETSRNHQSGDSHASRSCWISVSRAHALPLNSVQPPRPIGSGSSNRFSRPSQPGPLPFQPSSKPISNSGHRVFLTGPIPVSKPGFRVKPYSMVHGFFGPIAYSIRLHSQPNSRTKHSLPPAATTIRYRPPATTLRLLPLSNHFSD